MTTSAKAQENKSYDEKLSAYGVARSTIKGAPLSSEEVRKIDAYWRASLYLSLGMLYLKQNPLLLEPLAVEHLKPRMLGHWGSERRPELHLHPLQPPDQQIRSECDLYLRAGAWRTRSPVQ